jgi:hypothetical protein
MNTKQNVAQQYEKASFNEVCQYLQATPKNYRVYISIRPEALHWLLADHGHENDQTRKEILALPADHIANRPGHCTIFIFEARLTEA